ncbi:MAG: DUF1844 domain-containing protein [Planctomycetes bacterium]|nr:DUF1844 domain-containing protein [Planctomycetota bacterium]
MNADSYETDEDEQAEDERPASSVPLPGGDFRLFVTRLSFQAMLSLGLLENPLTGTKQVNRGGAEMLIADLEMLSDKTFGNLDPDESAYLEKILSDLRHHLARL